MSSPSSQLNNEHQPNLSEPVLPNHQPEHPGEEEEDRLIGKQAHEEAPVPQKAEPTKDQIIDPFHELIHNNDVVPVLAVLNRLDLTTIVEGKPLLSRLCTLRIPLEKILGDRQIIFTKDEDNRTALHDAIAADDVPAAYWCLKHKIGNHRDNFGNTPILEAIRLGRRACFLLCLHYQYMDSQAAHFCARHNRAWELKVLQKLGIDVLWSRDSQHFTPLERAVQNYSYDVAEFLTKLSTDFSMTDLAGRTDSKGILRLIKRTLKENSVWHNYLIPLFCIAANVLLVYYASALPIFSLYQSEITVCIAAITVLYLCLTLFSWKSTTEGGRQRSDFLGLLKAPEFPPGVEICPHCLVNQNENTQHCFQCNSCVQKFHYHEFVCVHGSNEVFWFGIELLWLWVTYSMHDLFYDSLKVGNLKILTYSSNFFFGNAAVVEELCNSQQYLLLFVFLFLKLFMVYQFCCLFQWMYMLVLNRTYQEANHTQRYVKLYRIGKTHEGSYKSQEIRLMEKGILKGCLRGIRNAILYFFS